MVSANPPPVAVVTDAGTLYCLTSRIARTVLCLIKKSYLREERERRGGEVRGDRQTDRQTDTQTQRQIGRQTDRYGEGLKAKSPE